MNEKKPKKRNFDGVQSVAEMLNLLDKGSRDRILAGVAEKNPLIAGRIQEQIFVFEDLVKFEAMELQILVRELPRRQLILALRNASQEFKKVLFKSMSARAANLLQEEVELLGPQKLSLVTQAQKEMVQTAKKLVAEGKLLLKK